MKLDKDPFLTNMNMVKFKGKKVMVQPSQAESTKGKEVVIGEERQPRMIKPKSSKDGQWRKFERSKPQQCPKAIFYILMAKYREGRADIREHENLIIQNTKSDSLISLSQASTSAAGCSSGKRSRTLPWQNSKGWDHHQRDYHLVPYFLVGPPMSGLWGPPQMMYPPCPPWMGWYETWAPSFMHFHSGWSKPTQGFDHGGYHAGDGRYRGFGQQQDRRSHRQENRTIQNPKPVGLVSLKTAKAPDQSHKQ
jgi:hypothetical protein